MYVNMGRIGHPEMVTFEFVRPLIRPDIRNATLVRPFQLFSTPDGKRALLQIT